MSVASFFKQLTLVILCTLILATSAHALSTEITVGFDGVVKSSNWIPIAVTFTNPGTDDIKGILTASQTNPEGNAPACSANVVLPGKSKKLYHVYTKLSGYSNTVKVTFISDSGTVISKNVNTTPATETDRLIVSVGNRTARLNFLNGEKLPAMAAFNRFGSSSPGESNINVGSIKPKELPDKPASYEGIDVLVLSELTPDSVNSRSLQALAMWVASGGTLVVSAGANYGEYSHEFYDDLLPVRVTGLTNLPGLSSLSSLGGTPFPAGPVTVAQCTVKPGTGRVMVSESGNPVLVERTYGAGRVIFLALDHQSSPFRDWNGQTEFWKSIIKSTPPGPTIRTAKGYVERGGGGYNPQEIEQRRTAMAAVVEQNPSVKTPSLSTIGMFLISYIVALVPVNFFVLKKRRKLEMAWVTTPAIIVVFTLGAYAVGYTMKGDRLQIREATIIEGSSSARYARAVSDASLFSPARRNYNIEIKDTFSLAQSIATEEGEKPSGGHIAENTVIEDVPMAMWSSKSFESVGGIDLGGTIESELVMSGGQAKGTVRNNTDYALEDCTVVFGDSSVDLGNLPKGGSALVDIQYTSSQSGVPFHSTSEDVRERLKSFAVNKASASSVPILVGSVKQDINFNIQRNRPATNNATCCIIRLDYKVAGLFIIQRGAISGRTEKMENGDVSYDGNSHSQNPGLTRIVVHNGGWFINSYNIPVPPDSKVVLLSPDIDGAVTPSVKFAIFNHVTGGWDKIEIGQDISNVAPYIRASGEVKFKVINKGGGPEQVNLVLSAVATRK